MPTAAGSITVASHVAGQFQGLIADLWAAGFRGHVNCYARGGHVRNSLHYRGEACDLGQTGWGKAPGIMYRSAAIIAAHGLRDGCSFRDCGHVDTGQRLAQHRAARRSYAGLRTWRRYGSVRVRHAHYAAIESSFDRHLQR